jgi:hypothetical protein
LIKAKIREGGEEEVGFEMRRSTDWNSYRDCCTGEVGMSKE